MPRGTFTTRLPAGGPIPPPPTPAGGPGGRGVALRTELVEGRRARGALRARALRLAGRRVRRGPVLEVGLDLGAALVGGGRVVGRSLLGSGALRVACLTGADQLALHPLAGAEQ